MYRRISVALVAVAAVSVGLVAPVAGASAPTKADPQKVCQAIASQPEGPKQELKAIRLAQSANAAALEKPLAAMEKAVKTGKRAATETKAYFANLTKVFAFAYEECADQQVEVIAKDFSYEGIPSTLEAGSFAMKMVNEGAEDHEIGIAKIDEGDSRSTQEIVDAIIATPQDQEPEGITFVTGGYAPKGSTGYVFGDLESGRYVYLCAIDVADGPEGNTHAEEGMFGEFTVA
jgi:hypothetical protein